jgi:hypothetical protein
MSTASRMPRHGNYQDMVLHELKVSDLTWDMLTGFSGPSRTAIHGNHMVFFPLQAFLRDAGLVDRYGRYSYTTSTLQMSRRLL